MSKRFRTVLQQLDGASAESIPWACQDWSNAKAAYRFFDNDRVSDADILAGHFRSTSERFASTCGTVLVLHDTTEFCYQRENIGLLHKPRLAQNAQWREKHPLRGLSMHSSLVVTTGGVPLGLGAARFWTRNKFKGANALKRKINPTRVPIEQKESIRWLLNLRESTSLLGKPDRCVHIGDRESDIFELFCAAHETGSHFLVRTCVDRLVNDGSCLCFRFVHCFGSFLEPSSEPQIKCAKQYLRYLAKEMAVVPVKGLHRIEVPDSKDKLAKVVLELEYRKIHIRPPVGKQSNYPPLDLTVLHAVERDAPQGRAPIEWKLLTDLPVASRKQAIEKLQWYALRWKIEVFHKVLKSGCKVEASGLRTAKRLIRLIATCCILAWRIFWMTMVNREEPQAPASIALIVDEIRVLDRLRAAKSNTTNKPLLLSDYITQIAKLGGYLARARDPAPGNIIMWRGLTRLADFTFGFSLKS
ncbi:IS4 family transposase [Cerasicoccus arenae]|uniref:IS4 family transposase n=2 Tax=Cerasicoccus arenae TaxID=424488 RepID=A0A8J3DLA7_9BACT|nr:IS4 family transposase [Cerasicoccus arenae]